jgi:predicted nucleic acid-binding protein
MTKVFWDTMLFIYLLEDSPVYGERVATLARRIEARGDVLCTSALVVAEVLTGLEKRGDAVLIARCRDFFASAAIVVLPFDLQSASHFAQLRSRHQLAAPDAIHLACAASYGVDLFVTQDKRLAGKIVPGIRFIVDLAQDVL